MPLHGTMSRKLRKGMGLQINEGKVYEAAVLFLNEKFLRLTETEADGTARQHLLRSGKNRFHPHPEPRRFGLTGCLPLRCG